ncbi:rhamnogalacturonan acetylesterase [Synoicihabitans lomoniglobus]|uniref:Rhamnogalacturonan acetylesterase n=1 Tax=Synoicihabitans lomoniglobus TaxID=2909285 RepID=A0AAF0CN78_9BACT|nr:rhamnogalacturonan acetylesterase [Opitutaceae bacterium LMO-M01]WED64251.1 rhamnogalacturonan acetylesterase [Opitutaceae bacterium LMO-M01]
MSLVLAAGLSVATASPVGPFWLEKTRAPAGATAVLPGALYDAERGYGYEPGVVPGQPFYFTADVPTEGNYRVTVTLGDAESAASTVVKAELRRLMVDRVDTAPGEFVRRSFIVNVRSPRIAATNGVAAGRVNLKAPRETTQEAWAWDDAITLEFNGAAPHVREILIEPAPALPTVFLIGDSTVCDQSREPYSSWGQMLTRFFAPTIAIANHAESGETYRDSIGRRRLDKLISVMRPGDYLFMQFGHNDQKQIKAGTGGPFTTYAAEMRAHIAAARNVGAVPVIVSPMERRGFDADGAVVPSLADYAAASRQVAAAEEVAFIDLNARSKVLYAALGETASAAAFAAPAGRQDNTHHNNYGAWLIAACVVDGIRATVPTVAAHLRTDLTSFDPVHPPVESLIHVPPSPLATAVRPLGD